MELIVEAVMLVQMLVLVEVVIVVFLMGDLMNPTNPRMINKRKDSRETKQN